MDRQSKRDNEEAHVLPAGITPEEARAMMSAAFNIFNRWQLSDDEACMLLGGPALCTSHDWKEMKLKDIPEETIWRLGDILGIYKALRCLFTDRTRGYDWVKRPSARLAGKSALKVVLKEPRENLTSIRIYLDAQLG